MRESAGLFFTWCPLHTQPIANIEVRALSTAAAKPFVIARNENLNENGKFVAEQCNRFSGLAHALIGRIEANITNSKQDKEFTHLIYPNSLFNIRMNYVRFELILNAPFPIISTPIVFTKLSGGDTLVSYRLTSQTIREGSDQDFSVKTGSTVNMFPSLPSNTLTFLKMEIAINSDDTADFSKVFGCEIWHSSHLYWQDRIFGEVNEIIDLARAGKAPQYIIRNVSTFDLRAARIAAVQNGEAKTLANYLLPQIVGEIDVPLDAIGKSVVPFYYLNYLDARRYCAEIKYREMQIAACNAIEAGSWHLWNLANGLLELNPQSEGEWHARYGAVAKGLSQEFNEKVKQPKSERDFVWRHRQKAMHGENVRIDYQEAHSIIDALTCWMNYVEQVATLLRKHKDRQAPLDAQQPNTR